MGIQITASKPEQLKIKRPTIASAGKDAKQLELSYIAGVTTNWYN